MKKVAYLVDTSFTTKLLKMKDVFFVPIQFTVNQNGVVTDYRDVIDIDNAKFNEIMKLKDIKITTSAVSLGSIISKTEEILNLGYDTIIAVCLSSGLSRTYENFVMAAKQMENKLFVIESDNVTTTGEWLVSDIMDMVKNGKTIDEILAYGKSFNQIRVAGSVVSNLNQLIAGGRLTGIKALIAKKVGLKLGIGFNGTLDMWYKSTDLDKSIKGLLDAYLELLKIDKKGVKRVALNSYIENDPQFEYFKKLVADYLEFDINKIQADLMPNAILSHLGVDSITIAVTK